MARQEFNRAILEHSRVVDRSNFFEAFGRHIFFTVFKSRGLSSLIFNQVNYSRQLINERIIEGMYRYGKKFGPWIKKDSLIRVENYYYDQIQGKSVSFYLDGSVAIVCYYVDSELNGPYTEYDENGLIILKGEYAMGRKSGEWLQLHNDRILAQSFYKDGLIDGRQLTFFPNGKIKSESFYDNSKMIGTWNSFYPDGSLQEQRINDGNNIYIVNFRNNRKKYEYNILNSFIDGEYKEWYNNGILRIQSFYEQGTLNGPYKEFYPNGNIRIEGNYKNGLENGKWFEFDEYRNVIATVKYKNGLLIPSE